MNIELGEGGPVNVELGQLGVSEGGMPTFRIDIEDNLSWADGWHLVKTRFTNDLHRGWFYPLHEVIYTELYRKLTHGHGLTPNQAVQVLATAHITSTTDMG